MILKGRSREGRLVVGRVCLVFLDSRFIGEILRKYKFSFYSLSFLRLEIMFFYYDFFTGLCIFGGF